MERRRIVTTVANAPADFAERERALAPDASFIVRAPAGSGKTELLTRRFLKLLATVDEPEEILAITFTRAATAEMRGRVLRDLEKARTGAGGGDDEAVQLARAALAHSEARGWRLLEQPHRLNIETIDSLCLRIARNQPLLSRLGGALSPVEDAGPLYAEAARRTLGLLGGADAELNAALSHLLEMRDNNLPECEDLLGKMLAKRDQWLRAFPLSGNMTEDDWDQARSRLEQPFREEVKRVHAEAYRLMMLEPVLAAELMELAQYACGNGNTKLGALAGVHALPVPEAMAVEHWRCLAHFLLTAGEWRKPGGLNAAAGFPKGTEQKRRMGSLLEKLRQIPGLRETLCDTMDLPQPRYEERQWTALRHIFMVLRRGVAELRVLFAERNAVDFLELNLAAQDVLRSPEAGADAMLALSGNIRHILVDEFQDTSRSQHDLLRLLIRAWEEDDGRTCFLVGDPMQSVYLFRQAEVELFEHVTRNGLVSEEHRVPFEPLELVTNFRSHEGLTTRWNEIFDEVFANGGGNGAAGVKYSHTYAAHEAIPGEAVSVHTQIVADGVGRPDPEEKARAREREAEQAQSIIEKHMGRIAEAQRAGNAYRVAVLARSRSHLTDIVKLLRARRIPFRAVDLETLNERQELIDLMSLTRALLHPMDRVTWLAVLRAPWCGLTLEDLHALTGADDAAFRYRSVQELIEQRLAYLSQDGATRLRRVAGILQRAIAGRFEGPHAMSFSQWIERTWRSLGGPQCMDADAYENAQTFFTLLDAVAPDGMECLTEDFEAEMERLYAKPDPRANERAGVQLMTIHKAKGLGFEVVIVPGLDRASAQDKSPLICSLERMSASGESEMLVAPIGYRGDDRHPTYAWVQSRIKMRSDEELKRLLYVSCTRARMELHLLGTATMTHSGLKPGNANSLLATAWPALEADFERAADAKARSQKDKVIPFPAGPDRAISLELAAAAEDDKPKLRLRRLKAGADAGPTRTNIVFAGADAATFEAPPARPHGSRDARQKGNVVHALLQQFSGGAVIESLDSAARSLLRAAAYSGKALDEAIEEVLRAVKNCVSDPDGAWILSAHAQARSETSWTGWKGGALETLRADRVFVAGAAPRATGEDHLWIIDYKMSAPAGDTNFLAKERATYAPQLARYARALRDAEGMTLPVRFGLYYPRFEAHAGKLDWWAE